MAEEDKFDKEVYKTLYEFQLKGFDSVKALHAKHEDKAAKYLTFTSLMVTAISIFSKQYLFDNSEKGILFFIIVFLIFIVFISLCCIARNLFLVMEVGNVGKLDNSEEMVKFFSQNELTSIYYNLSKDLSGVIQKYEERNDIKVDYLKRAFKEIKFCGLMFVLTVILIIIDTLFI